MANDEPKPLSAELKALRAEFAEVAERSKKALSQLDTAIFKAEMSELKDANNKVLDEFTLPGNRSSIAGHDVVILINKSKDMGEGYNSPIGAAIAAAGKMSAAASGNDGIVSAALYDTGTANHLRLNDSDRTDKARAKTEKNDKNLFGVVREIMIANTSDKPAARTKHYVIVSDGNATDNLEATAQLIETTLRHNPKVTFDFINIGTNAGNIPTLAGLVNAAAPALAPAVHHAEKADDIWGVLTAVVKARLAQTQAAPQEAPKAVAVAASKDGASPAI